MNKLYICLYINLMMLNVPLHAETPPEKQIETTNQPALTVTTVTPSSVTWPVTIAATGGLYAWQEAIIASEIGGLRIVEILADVGETVKKGKLLAILERDTVEATLAQRRAEVAQAQVAVAQAKSEAARARKAKNSLSKQLVEQYLFTQERTQAALDAIVAAQRNEEIRLEKTRIYAVDDGTISSRNATLGAVVQVGSELFRIVRKNRIEWQAEVTAEQISQIQVKQKARIELPDGTTVKGKVRMIAPTLDPKTRKALVYINLSKNNQVRAGMFARGEIIISKSKVTTLPTSAVILRDGFNYLFIVTPDNTVEQMKVAIGRVKDDQIEILTRLSSKTAVVLSGGAFLENGDKVTVTQANTTTDAILNSKK